MNCEVSSFIVPVFALVPALVRFLTLVFEFESSIWTAGSEFEDVTEPGADPDADCLLRFNC